VKVRLIFGVFFSLPRKKPPVNRFFNLFIETFNVIDFSSGQCIIKKRQASVLWADALARSANQTTRQTEI